MNAERTFCRRDNVRVRYTVVSRVSARRVWYRRRLPHGERKSPRLLGTPPLRTRRVQTE